MRVKTKMVVFANLTQSILANISLAKLNDTTVLHGVSNNTTCTYLFNGKVRVSIQADKCHTIYHI